MFLPLFSQYSQAGVYSVMMQLKILTTGVFSVIVLKKKLSFGQWKALVLLVLGAIIIQGPSKNEDGKENSLIGVCRS